MLLLSCIARAIYLLMRFLDYYNTMNSEQRREFAKRVGTSPAYLFHVARGYRYPNGKLALAIIDAAGGQVPAKPESFGPPEEHTLQPKAA